MQLLPFATPLVAAAVASADGLYVRGDEALAAVSPDGSVRELYSFGLQVITAYEGLAQLGDSLFTFDRPLNGPTELLEVPVAGAAATRRVPYRRPVGLAAVAGELLLLDALVPITQVWRSRAGQRTLVAEARNLTHWFATAEALWWSDGAGIWQYRAGTVTQLLAQPDILRFTAALTSVAQHLAAGRPLLTVQTATGATTAPVATEYPLMLYDLPAATLLRIGPRLAPASDPAAGWPLADDPDEVGALLVAAGQLWHLAGRTQLRASPDGQRWTTIDLPLPCSRLCPDGAGGLVASGRRGAVWLRP